MTLAWHGAMGKEQILCLLSILRWLQCLLHRPRQPRAAWSDFMDSKGLKLCIQLFFFSLEQIMEEDQEHGALVSICDVLQEEVPLDSASRTCR